MNLADLNATLPALLLMAGAFAIVLVDLLLKKDARRDALEYIAYASLAGVLVDIVRKLDLRGLYGFHGAVFWDGFSLFMSTAIIAATALSLMMAQDLIARFKVMAAEYYALLLIAASGMIFMTMAADLMTLFVSIEIVSLCVYVLTGITRRSAASNEASLKYFVMGAFATGFLLYGMTLIYGTTGALQFKDIRAALTLTPLQIIGIGLMTVGFGFKIGLVPFHSWVPDVYEGAPTAVTAFMSVSVKAAGFAALVRVFVGSAGQAAWLWGDLLFYGAILTMVLGNIMALAQNNVKRMLAYSSIAHTGYALIGVACASVKGSYSAEGPLAATSFYLFAYTFMTLGAFAFLILAGRGGRDAGNLGDCEGLAHERPATAVMMAVFMFSLAGVPPTAGFFGKFYLFKAAIESNESRFTWLVIVGVCTTIISLYYYLRVVVVMFMKPAAPKEGTPSRDPSVMAAVAIAALFTLLIGIFPSNHLNLSIQCIRSLLTLQ